MSTTSFLNGIEILEFANLEKNPVFTNKHDCIIYFKAYYNNYCFDFVSKGSHDVFRVQKWYSCRLPV